MSLSAIENNTWLAGVPTVSEVKDQGLSGPAGLASSWPQGGPRVRVSLSRGRSVGARVLAIDGDRAVICPDSGSLSTGSLIGSRFIADLTRSA